MKQMIAAAGLLLMLAACGGEKNVSLENTQWKLQSAAGIPTGAIEAEADNFTLNFEARTVSGRTNCNLFFGEYATEGSKIEFSQMGMTRMACPDNAHIITFFYKRHNFFSLFGKVFLLHKA